MKKLAYILILTALAATSFASKVTNVELAFSNGETVARIDVSGQIRFTHQTEIPKDGKPDRLIVDVLTATHELGGKVFEDLPLCPVTAVRSSQYSVKPEAVVRIVFDMKKTPVYQVETQGQSIVVRIIDKTATPFPTWATSQYLKLTPKATPAMAAQPKPEMAKPLASATTPAQKTASAEGDRQSSLATAPSKPATANSPMTPMADKGFITAPKPSAPTPAPAAPVPASSPVSPKPQTPAVAIVPAPTQPAAVSTVAATPKTDSKPVDSKPSTNSPAPSVSALPKSEMKPAESKPAVPVAKPATTATQSAPESKSDVVWTPPSNTKPNIPAPAIATPAKTDPAPPAPKTEFKPTEAQPSAAVVTSPVTPAVNAAKPTTSAPITLSPSAPATTVVTPVAKPTPSVATSPSPSVATKPTMPSPAPSTAVAPVATPAKVTDVKPATPASPIPNTVKPTERPVPGSPLPSELAQKAKEPVKPVVRIEKPYTADDDFMPEPEDLEPAEANPYVDYDSPAGAQWADTKESVDSNSTARFRRHPLSAAKIKGTMIAQFPQRLVIKYQTGGTRDPFATLIDDSRTFNTPTKQGVPNVDGMRLVGVIVARQGGNRALFLDKGGYSYMLQSGDKVRNGYVLRIESDRAYFQIFEYGWSRTVALKIDES